MATEQTNTVDEPEEQISQPLFQVTAFLSCLTQEYNDGRVVVSREMTIGKSTIKYLLLEPASVVTDIVNKARSETNIIMSLFSLLFHFVMTMINIIL